MRHLEAAGRTWGYVVGSWSVRITSPRTGKSVVVDVAAITGRSPSDFERGRYKRTSDGMVKPGHIKGYIEKLARYPGLKGSEIMNESIESKPKARKKGTQRRGFAAISPERQREIASLGGKAAHALGKAHEFSPEEAKRAGSIGGKAAHARRAAKGKESEP